jgi:hypothetical protein
MIKFRRANWFGETIAYRLSVQTTLKLGESRKTLITVHPACGVVTTELGAECRQGIQIDYLHVVDTVIRLRLKLKSIFRHL